MSLEPLAALLRSTDPVAFLRISRDWRSLLRMHFLHAAFEAGLLRALREPRSRDELVGTLRVQRPEILDALLELGVSLGEIASSQGTFRLRGPRSRALADPRNDALAAMVQANVTYYNTAYRDLAHLMTGGASGDGPDGFGALVARVSRISEPYVTHHLRRLLKGRGPLRVLDVGCGSGLHLKVVLEAHPESEGVGLEADREVVGQASENLSRWGLGHRARVVHGNGAEAARAVDGPFDLVLLMSVIYYVPVAERVVFLRGLGSLLSPGGCLLVATSCRGAGIDPFSANLNVATSSMEGLTPLPTPEEMEGHLREAGFATVDRTRLVPGTTYFCFRAS